jgi:phage-related protein
VASISVGSVTVDVVPSVRDFASRMRREMIPQATEIGREVGQRIQQGIEREVKPVSIRVNLGTALPRLERLKKALEEIDGKSVNVQVRVDMANSVAEMRLLQQLLNRLDGRNININFNMQVAAAQAQMAALQAQLRSIDNRKTININADVGGALASIFSLKAALIGLGVVSLPAITGIGAGIVGLVGPLAAAGVGFAGLGAVAIPAISRIRDAQKQQAQATQAAAGAAGQAQARAYALAGAQQQLASAIRNAAQAHQQALEQVRQAQQQLTQAQIAAATAERDLAAARVQARRSLEDLKNQVISAGLAVQEQQLAIQEARARWQELAQAVTAASAKITTAQTALAAAQAAQQKVLADPAATEQAKAQAKANVDAAKAAVQAAKDEKKAAELAAKQAEINFKQSLQRLKEQQLQLRRLRQDEAAASKAGVEGSDQVRSARERLADANRRITEAERALANARANVARVDQQSADQVASARRALAQASSQAASSTAALTGPMVRLTALEQQLANAWKGLTAEFTAWNKALQPAVIPVLIKGISLLRASLPLLTPAVRGAAIGLSYLLDRANAAAKSPFWTQFSTFLGQAAAPAIIGLGTLIGNLLKGFAGMAQAFAPIGFAFLTVLNMIAERFAAFMTGLSSNPAFKQFTQQFQAIAPLMAQTFISLGRLLGSLFAALAPALQPSLAFLNTFATALSNVLRQIGPSVQSVLTTLGQGLSAVIVALAPVVVQLVQALAPLLNQLINGLKPILLALVPVIGQVIAALAPVISALLAGLQPAIASLVPVVSLLVGALGRILVALAPILPLLGQFIASLVAGLMPALTPIIDVLAQVGEQLAAALIQTLRAALPAVQQIVVAVASLLPALLPLIPLWLQLELAILPLLPALIKLVAIVVQLLVPVLRLIIVVLVAVASMILRLLIPVIQAAVAAIVWFAGLVAPLISGIGAVFRALGTAAMWLWSNAIQPAFKLIAGYAKWLYSVIAFAVIAPLMIQFKMWAAIAKWLWSSIIKPVFSAIGSFIRSTWNSVIKPVLNALVSVFRNVIAPAFRWIYNSVIKPVWNSVGTAIRGVWTGFIRPTFDGIKSALNKLAPYFRTAVDAIGKAWSGLKEAAKKPVSFVVNTVFNSGIVKIWDAVAKLVPGMKKLEPIRGFARGGVMPGYAPGKDRLLAAVSPGESIFRPEFTKAVGEKFVTGANTAARSGGVSGVVRYLGMAGDPGMGPGFAGHFALGGVVGGFLKAAKGWFANGLVKTATAAFNPLVSSAQRAIGGTAFGDLAVNAVRGLTSRILGYFKPLEQKIGGGGSVGAVRAVRSVIGTPYSWGGGGPHGPSRGFGRGANTVGFDCSSLMQYGWYQAAHKVMPRTTYTQRPWLRRISQPVPGAVGQPHPGHTYMYSGNGKIIEAPFTGGFVREVPMRNTPFWGLPPFKFDNGGYLPTGVSMVYNGTGSPEPVLTDAQWAKLADSTSGGDGGVHYHGHFDGMTKAAYEAQFRTAMQAEAIRAAQRDRTGRRR